MKKYRVVSPEIEAVAAQVVDGAFRVHQELGPGLLESIYETCMCHELMLRKIPFRSQVEYPIAYRGVKLDGKLRLDLIVAELVIVEIKSVELIRPVFEAQVISYLKLTKLWLGFLINFNVPLIRSGIQRLVV